MNIVMIQQKAVPHSSFFFLLADLILKWNKMINIQNLYIENTSVKI